MSIIIFQPEPDTLEIARVVQFARPGTSIYLEGEWAYQEALNWAAMFPEKKLTISRVNLSETEPPDGLGGLTLSFKPMK
jgi:hypothetical protein